MGMAHGFKPLSVGLGGLAVWGHLMFPAGNLRARSLKVVIKGKAVPSPGMDGICARHLGRTLPGWGLCQPQLQ